MAGHHRPWIAKLDMTPSGVAYHHGQWAIYTVRRHWPWQCHHRPWNVHMVEWLRAWNAIIVLGKIHDQTTFGVACYHLPSKTHTIGQCAAWHDRMELRQHTRLDDFRRWMLSSPLDSKTRSNTIGHGIPSWPLGNIHGQTTWDVAMPSSPLECTHGRMTSSLACHHRPLKNTRSNDD